MEIARALAGNTAPYLRTIGAPYHKAKVSMTVETSRAQAFWCRGRGIELFSEGDVYPRPRYNTPARLLELFDLGCIATGEFDGILKYMYDYVQPFGYETGYTDRHIRNKEIRTQLKEITKGKQATGIRVIDVMEKTENWHLPQNPPEEVSAYLAAALENTRSAKCILTDNAIPTTYADTGAPVFVMGENAYYVEEADLRNGALLDISAAKILTERGFDVGLIGAKKADFTGESYIKENSTVSGFKNTELFRLVCKEGVQIETSLMPDKTPGSYRYENEKGQRFFVLAASLMGESYQPVVANANYTSNYYRKVQLTDAIEYVSGKKMVVKTTAKCPDLYMIALENEDRSALAVSVMNPFVDDAERVEFTLDKQYSSVRFIGCTGSLEGEKVIIDSIEPYGFAAFEIKL